MGKGPITPKSYTAASETKHVRQIVVILPPAAAVEPRVQNLVLGGAAGIAFLSASWAATAAFLDRESGQGNEGPFVFAKATGIAEALKGQAAMVAFGFYRMRLGGLVQMFVQVDTPDVRAKTDDRYVSERPFDIESGDELELLQGLITRDELELCFVAPGESGPCTGQFGLRASFPEDVRRLLNKELEDLLAYDRALSGRHGQGAVDQYNRENPMDATPVLSPNLDTRKFLGMSEEKALEEVGRSGVRQEDVCEVRTTRPRQQKKAEGSGKDAESAIDNAKALLPSDAIDIAPPQIVQEGQRGSLDVEAETEAEARSAVRRRVPTGAICETVECLERPRRRFLGLGKSSGRWKVLWATSFKVEIAYVLPIEVTASWFKRL